MLQPRPEYPIFLSPFSFLEITEIYKVLLTIRPTNYVIKAKNLTVESRFILDFRQHVTSWEDGVDAVKKTIDKLNGLLFTNQPW
jgi:hypothetical protein